MPRLLAAALCGTSIAFCSIVAPKTCLQLKALGSDFIVFAGFDYGTSNCSIGVIDSGRAELCPLDGDSRQIASNLYAPNVQLGLKRVNQTRLDTHAPAFQALRFGEAALQAYLTDPTTGYYVKSPKSFLGAAGLNEEIQERFVYIIAAMMCNIRYKAQESCGAELAQIVIGRPVNFQGTDGDAANTRALTMLTQAARLAGFDEPAFQYEPMAAALEYETRLREETRVLVVDIGGGTTDCSFVRIGPDRISRIDRSADILGHAGERMGGNDYDQLLALQEVMPELGFGDALNSGRPIPNPYFVDAVSINDVNAQQRFYSAQTLERLRFFATESVAPERAERLLKLRQGRDTYRLIRDVELGKVRLSHDTEADIPLGFLDTGLIVRTDRLRFQHAVERLLEHLAALVSQTVAHAQSTPDVIYLTGGMSGSAIVRQHLAGLFRDVPQVDSDHFASVTEGLTLWAQRMYQ